MIKINLLPEEFREKEQKSSREIPILKIGIGAAALLAILTIWFYIDFLLSSSRLRELETKWKAVQPEALVLSQLKQEVEAVLKSERDFLAAHVANEEPLTHKLMWLSEFLPEMAWLSEIKLQNDLEGHTLMVKGLCLPSREKTSIQNIEDYLHQIKGKMPEVKLSLTTSRQIVEDTELTQFIALFDLGKDMKP